MKRSKNVFAPLLAFVAALVLQGCDDPQDVRRCVDEQGNVVDDRLCPAETNRVLSYDSSGHPHATIYRYYYGGSGYESGQRVGGGSYTRTPGTSYVSRPSISGVSRGGFGASFSSHGAGA